MRQHRNALQGEGLHLLAKVWLADLTTVYRHENYRVPDLGRHRRYT